MMPIRELPGVGQQISLLGLGSYETLCYLEYQEIVRLVTTAAEAGVTLFDVAHYRRAPHTEVVLTRALQDAGLQREDYVLVTKVWGRDDTSMAEQLQESLFRLGTDHVDGVLCYGPRWDIGDPVAQAQETAGLVQSGLARWWGGLNWSATDLVTAQQSLQRQSLPQPVLMQMKYNFARKNIVESPEYQRIWAEGQILLQASDSLEGGVLAGKVNSERVLGRDPGGVRSQIQDRIPDLRKVAAEFDLSLAQLAVVFAASFEHAGNVLVGSSKPSQLTENAQAVARAAEVGADVRTRLAELEIVGHTLDVPPGTVVAPGQSPYQDDAQAGVRAQA